MMYIIKYPLLLLFSFDLSPWIKLLRITWQHTYGVKPFLKRSVCYCDMLILLSFVCLKIKYSWTHMSTDNIPAELRKTFFFRVYSQAVHEGEILCLQVYVYL